MEEKLRKKDREGSHTKSVLEETEDLEVSLRVTSWKV